MSTSANICCYWLQHKKVTIDRLFYSLIFFANNKYIKLGEEYHNSILSRLFGLWWLSYHKWCYHQFMCFLNRKLSITMFWSRNNDKLIFGQVNNVSIGSYYAYIILVFKLFENIYTHPTRSISFIKKNSSPWLTNCSISFYS